MARYHGSMMWLTLLVARIGWAAPPVDVWVDVKSPEQSAQVRAIGLGFVEGQHKTAYRMHAEPHMLQSLDDPSSIGPAMAVALLTTMYGAVVAFVLDIAGHG